MSETNPVETTCSDLPRHFRGPFSYEEHGQRIYDANGTLVLDVRAWGYLTGKGSLDLPERLAIAAQDQFGRFVVEKMNAENVGASDASACSSGYRRTCQYCRKDFSSPDRFAIVCPTCKNAEVSDD